MKRQFCRDCETVAKPKKRTPGSLWLELFLWIFLIVPGFIYSLWRLSGRHPVCRACGSRRIIPTSTPQAARAIAAEDATVGFQGANDR